MKQRAILNFSKNIQKLLDGQKLDLYSSLIDAHFEYIAAEILSPQLESGVWFNGTNDLKCDIFKPELVEFRGTMNVMQGTSCSRKPFFARVIKPQYKNGTMPIYVSVDGIKGKKDLYKIKWKYKNA